MRDTPVTVSVGSTPTKLFPLVEGQCNGISVNATLGEIQIEEDGVYDLKWIINADVPEERTWALGVYVNGSLDFESEVEVTENGSTLDTFLSGTRILELEGGDIIDIRISLSSSGNITLKDCEINITKVD